MTISATVARPLLKPYPTDHLTRRANEQATVMESLHAEIRSEALRPGEGLR
ncbi:MAG: hypothetical protein Q4G67_12415 [Actinomycetia bacterium]|nr:hypothetical protein [Actinomycetes bacterium]